MGRRELMMPRVIVPASPNGFPMAKVFWPTCRFLESPSTAGTTPGASILTTADRKSTRLNSSHLGISYAVFCLKKKKKTHNKSHHSILHVQSATVPVTHTTQ